MNFKPLLLLISALSLLLPHAFAAEPTIITVDEDQPYAMGFSAAVEGDRLILAARGAYVGNNRSQGKVYVLERQGDEWIQVAELVSPEGEEHDNFGYAVDLEGDTLVASAPLENVGEQEFAGAFYVFNLVDGEWQMSERITAEDARRRDEFGEKLAIDGGVVLAGGLRKADPDNNVFKPEGKVYFFEYDPSREQWQQVARFGPDDTPYIGRTMDFDSGTGVTGNFIEGTLWIIEHDGQGWEKVQEFQLDEHGDESRDHYVPRIAIEGDTILGTAPAYERDGRQEGLVHVIEHNGERWQEVEPLRPPTDELEEFGHAFAFHENLLAAIGVNDNTVYLMRKLADDWELITTIEDPDPNNPDRRSPPLALSDDYLVLEGYSAAIVYELDDLIPGRGDDETDTGGNGGDGNTGNDDDSGSDDDNTGGNDGGNDNGEDVSDDDSSGVAGGNGGSGDDSSGSDDDADDEASGNDDEGGGDTGGTGGDTGSDEPTTTSGDGGGGAFAWLTTVLLPLLARRRVALTARRSASFIVLMAVAGLPMALNAAPEPREIRRDGQGFGGTVEIEGNVMAIGASAAEVGGNRHQGLVYLFQYEDGEWRDAGQLSDGDADDHFGSDIEIEGNWMVISAPSGDDQGVQDAGVVHVYERDVSSDTGWRYNARIAVDDPDETGALFGFGIGVGDNRIIVSAPTHGREDSIDSYGAEFIYEYNSATLTWEQIASLQRERNTQDRDGTWDVDIKGDTAVLSTDRGGLYIYDYDGEQWQQVFGEWVGVDGRDVKIEDDVIAVGLPHGTVHGEGKYGFVQLFERIDGEWQESDRLRAPEPVHGGEYGRAMDMNDGLIAISGHGDPVITTLTMRNADGEWETVRQIEGYPPGETHYLAVSARSLAIGWPNVEDQVVYLFDTAELLPEQDDGNDNGSNDDGQDDEQTGDDGNDSGSGAGGRDEDSGEDSDSDTSGDNSDAGNDDDEGQGIAGGSESDDADDEDDTSGDGESADDTGDETAGETGGPDEESTPSSSGGGMLTWMIGLLLLPMSWLRRYQY